MCLCLGLTVPSLVSRHWQTSTLHTKAALSEHGVTDVRIFRNQRS